MSRSSFFSKLTEGLYYSVTLHLIFVFLLLFLINTFAKQPTYKAQYIEFELGDGGGPGVIPAQLQAPQIEEIKPQPKTGAEKIIGYEEFKQQLFNPNKNKPTNLNGGGAVNAGGSGTSECSKYDVVYKTHSTPLKNHAYIGYTTYEYKNFGPSKHKNPMSIDVSAFSGELTLCSHENTAWQIKGNYSNITKINFIDPGSTVNVSGNIPTERLVTAMPGRHQDCEEFYEQRKYEFSKSFYSHHGKCTENAISTFGQLENEFRP